MTYSLCKCTNENCLTRMGCWRFMCPPQEDAQAYWCFKPYSRGRCHFFINLPGKGKDQDK
jgi:hypothetical protein